MWEGETETAFHLLGYFPDGTKSGQGQELHPDLPWVRQTSRHVGQLSLASQPHLIRKPHRKQRSQDLKQH